MDKLTQLKTKPFPEPTAQQQDSLPKPSPGEDQPVIVTESQLPHKTPWSTTAAVEAAQLAHQSELDAAQAELDAKAKRAALQMNATAAGMVAADEAETNAQELELKAKMAEEVAQEQQQWAIEQGELRFANHLIQQDPELYNVDENTTLPKT